MHHVVSPDRIRGRNSCLLVGSSVGDQRRAHLAVGEPERGDRSAGLDHLLADDQSLDRRSPAPAEVLRPGHADPALRRHFLGELLRVAVDPRVVVPAEPGDRLGGYLAGTLAQFDLLGRST